MHEAEMYLHACHYSIILQNVMAIYLNQYVWLSQLHVYSPMVLNECTESELHVCGNHILTPHCMHAYILS